MDTCILYLFAFFNWTPEATVELVATQMDVFQSGPPVTGFTLRQQREVRVESKSHRAIHIACTDSFRHVINLLF